MLFKGKLELLVLLPNVAGVEIATSHERVMADQPSHEKRHGNLVNLDKKLAETNKELVHEEIIAKKAA